jgi:hypothetical protein
LKNFQDGSYFSNFKNFYNNNNNNNNNASADNPDINFLNKNNYIVNNNNNNNNNNITNAKTINPFSSFSTTFKSPIATLTMIASMEDVEVDVVKSLSELSRNFLRDSHNSKSTILKTEDNDDTVVINDKEIVIKNENILSTITNNNNNNNNNNNAISHNNSLSTASIKNIDSNNSNKNNNGNSNRSRGRSSSLPFLDKKNFSFLNRISSRDNSNNNNNNNNNKGTAKLQNFILHGITQKNKCNLLIICLITIIIIFFV